jgi:UDP-3-O-[3-hydroxymyristoyl] glucosamine N-acyltransferase
LWVHDEPRLALAQTLELLYPEPQVEPTIHPTAVVASSAHVEDTACVEALAVVQDHACVGARTVVGPRAVIGRQARLGTDCLVGPGAMVLDRCRLGDRVRVGPGTVVGSDGFGFVPDREGARRVPQRGDVVVEDDVELGALVTVDRGTLGHTTIRRGTKVDNQVHLGHNVDVGPHAIIAAQTGLAGSVRLGAGVMAGGQVGVADHLVVGDGARLAARSGVVSDVPAGATYAGYPALPRHQWLRLWAKLGRLQGSHKEVET